MANSPAFSLQGSTPNVFASSANNTSTASTPVAKALSTAKNPFNPFTNPVKPATSNPLASPNFQTLTGQTTYQAPPQTAPIYTSSGIIPSPLASLGQNQKTSAAPISGGILPAQTTQNTAAAVDNSGGTQNPNANYLGGQNNSSAPIQNSGVTQNPVTYPGLLQQQAQFDPFANPAVSSAYQKAQDINTQLAQAKLNEANGEKTLLTQAIPLGDSQGQAQVYRNQSLAQQNALSSELQGQAGLFGAGFTGTGQQLTGLNAAASGAKPELGSIGQVPFNPLTQGQGNVLGSAQPGGVAAAGNLLGQFQGAQAAGSALGGVTASQTQQVEGYKSALQQGQNLQSQLTDLISTFGLNPNDLNTANIGIQKIAQNTSSPQYKILANYVNDIANTYSQILTPPGGSATDTTRGIATSMLDATASGQSLLSVMQSLDNAAQAKIAGVQTTGSSSTGSSGSTSGFGWNGN